MATSIANCKAAVLLAVAATGVVSAEESTSNVRVRQLRAVAEKLKPLHRPLGRPQPGDWLASHPEPGQTFLEYLACQPVRPVGTRRVIYVQPLGDFTKKQREIVDLSAEYMSRYFNRPVRIREDIPLSVIPARARRVHPDWGEKQILTSYVLNDVLRPKLPRDAAAYIAFTASDLWPGEGWNFVFGQATLRHRVGVWSIHRNGDPEAGDDEFRLCLKRTLKTATHETGHMFSMRHCIAYQCNMCGSNHRAESDRQPLYLGPECLAKVCWATGADPIDRFIGLASFCRKHELQQEAEYYEKAIEILKSD
jgi:archaemetzincin